LAAFAFSSCSRIQLLLLRPIAFGFRFLWRHLPAVHSASLSVDLPGRSVSQNTVWFLSCDRFFCCMGHSGISTFRSPGIFCELSFLISPVP
jgi:hypothetical protein